MNPITIVSLIIVIVIIILMILINSGKIQGKPKEQEKINSVSKKRKNKKTINEEEVQSSTELIVYSTYEMSKGEVIRYTLMAGVFLFALGYLFYRNIIFSLILSLIAIKYPKIKKVNIIKKRLKKLQLEFKDALYSIYTSVSAGSSPTNAIIESVEDLKRLYIDDNNFIIPELEIMKSRLLMNQPIEEVLRDFAYRSGLDDIENFCEVFITSMDTGGRQAGIIKSTINSIIEKIEIKREIEVLIAEKKFEAKIMNAMPVMIIVFLSFAASDYLEPLFIEPIGKVIVTFVIAILIIGNLIANKIMDIEV